MTNGDSGLRLIGEIQRAVAQEYGWPDGRVEEHTLAKIDPASLRAYTGVYLFKGLFRFTITQDKGKLYLQYGAFGRSLKNCLRNRTLVSSSQASRSWSISRKKPTDR